MVACCAGRDRLEAGSPLAVVETLLPIPLHASDSATHAARIEETLGSWLQNHPGEVVTGLALKFRRDLNSIPGRVYYEYRFSVESVSPTADDPLFSLRGQQDIRVLCNDRRHFGQRLDVLDVGEFIRTEFKIPAGQQVALIAHDSGEHWVGGTKWTRDVVAVVLQPGERPAV